jgi:hypothetical protein
MSALNGGNMNHMRDPKPYVVRLGIFAVVVGAICTLVPSALGQTKPEVLPAGASANVWLAGGQAIVEAAQPEQTVPSGPLPATPWGTPVLVSPRNGTPLYHYPRTTTLIWQPVLTATAYVVEAAYLSGSTWTAYPPVTVTGNSNAFYTFTFVGDQKGRWRVTAFNGTVYSSPSAWWTFSYNTTAQMATPIQTNPANNEIFGHYPRALTLSWKMVPAAAGYNLEIAYCDSTRTTCVSYPIVTITDPLQSDYTFNFVGAQPGKWRVTTLAGTGYRNSTATAWHWFTFTQ